ncbi:hypothetical protein [Streptomyces sp. bgisy126]|uniref:hypothetical protein n=1 Tax=unclassified Streptomyces TaxID=2593676 RepID=UPI003EB6BB3F
MGCGPFLWIPRVVRSRRPIISWTSNRADLERSSRPSGTTTHDGFGGVRGASRSPCRAGATSFLLAAARPLALAVGAPAEQPAPTRPPDATARLRTLARLTATARAPHLPRTALAVVDLPDHDFAPAALAHPAALGRVHCHGGP